MKIKKNIAIAVFSFVSMSVGYKASASIGAELCYRIIDDNNGKYFSAQNKENINSGDLMGLGTSASCKTFIGPVFLGANACWFSENNKVSNYLFSVGDKGAVEAQYAGISFSGQSIMFSSGKKVTLCEEHDTYCIIGVSSGLYGGTILPSTSSDKRIFINTSQQQSAVVEVRSKDIHLKWIGLFYGVSGIDSDKSFYLNCSLGGSVYHRGEISCVSPSGFSDIYELETGSAVVCFIKCGVDVFTFSGMEISLNLGFDGVYFELFGYRISDPKWSHDINTLNNQLHGFPNFTKFSAGIQLEYFI